MPALEPCAKCGTLTRIEELDAKPERLAGRRGTSRQIKKAFRRRHGEDFDRLECAKCYGPAFVRLPREGIGQ